MLWALAQPAALAGLVAAFGLGVGLRAAAQWLAARALGAVRTGGLGAVRAGGLGAVPRRRMDPLGVVAAVLTGTGWGRTALPPASRRERWGVLAGPAAVLLASQLAFVAYHETFPRLGLPLRLYRPSDVLHGAVAPSAAQLMLSVAVGLLCFGLLALLPLPPFDGYRLITTPGRTRPGAGERIVALVVFVLLVVPVAGRPPLVMALDAVAGPLVRAWA